MIGVVPKKTEPCSLTLVHVVNYYSIAANEEVQRILRESFAEHKVILVIERYPSIPSPSSHDLQVLSDVFAPVRLYVFSPFQIIDVLKVRRLVKSVVGTYVSDGTFSFGQKVLLSRFKGHTFLSLCVVVPYIWTAANPEKSVQTRKTKFRLRVLATVSKTRDIILRILLSALISPTLRGYTQEERYFGSRPNKNMTYLFTCPIIRGMHLACMPKTHTKLLRTTATNPQKCEGEPAASRLIVLADPSLALSQLVIRNLSEILISEPNLTAIEVRPHPRGSLHDLTRLVEDIAAVAGIATSLGQGSTKLGEPDCCYLVGFSSALTELVKAGSTLYLSSAAVEGKNMLEAVRFIVDFAEEYGARIRWI